MFLSYLVIKRLIQEELTIPRWNDFHCYLFDKNQKRLLVDSVFLLNMDETTKSKLWILTNTAIAD